ncbi:nucleotide exchange factor GrpE [Myxococcota bacterium]|nr:nucleotide exchange factor GrpE [Myxococcota bacterium]MCZ7620135.1 nucleotide exchange factor GrpE [Myxococcota bacterium]
MSDEKSWDPEDDSQAAGLETSPELEEAMREAARSIEERAAQRRAEEAGDDPDAATSGAHEARIAALEQELAEAGDRILRLAADLDNFRKRALKEREEAHHFGHQNLVKDLLPSVDNLERAVDHARKSGKEATSGLLEGVELVLRELLSVLAKHGVTPIEALGQPFDPALHEAMAQVPDGSQPPGTVVEVFQRGYQLRARLLRPARVVVSKLPDGADTGNQANDG